jgi:integrase
VERDEPPSANTNLKQTPNDCPHSTSENVGAYGLTMMKKGLNYFSNNSRKCRVCAWEVQAKNSVSQELNPMENAAEAEKRAAGATELNQADVEGKIIEFLWWMKKQGYSDSSILTRGKKLKRLLSLGVDLLDPDSVKDVVARQKWSLGTKEIVVDSYDLFAKWIGLKWDKPTYKKVQKLPFIPLEREIDDLIASCSKRISAFLQIAKETGARAGEIFNLKWKDVDFERRIVTIEPEKGSEPRVFKVSEKLLNMLGKIPRDGDRIFSRYKNLSNLTSVFERQRKRAAHKLGNARLIRISFHTIRHWKATTEYAKTKDILYVMKMLGHKNIKNTLIYTQLVKFESDDEYVCKVAKTPDEIAKLIEAGFEYVCEHDGLKFFRKRK